MLGAGVSPAHVMLGRNSLLDSLARAKWIESSTDCDVSRTIQPQMQAALQARSAVILEDARRVVNLGVSRNIRVGANQDFKLCDVAQLYMKDDDTNSERWIP